MRHSQERSNGDAICNCHNCKRDIIVQEDILCLECAEQMCDNAYLAGTQDAQDESD